MPPPDLQVILASVGAGRSAASFEDDHLDFKSAAAEPKQTFALLADAVVCFANAEGGTIVLGVDDKATTRSGCLLGAAGVYTIPAVRKAIFDRTKPSLTVTAEELVVDGVRLIAIHVPPGIAIHSNTAGLATRRLATECLPFTPQEQREVRVARGELDWSAAPSQASVADLSDIQIDRVRRLLGAAGSQELSQLSNRRLLEALRLVTTRGQVSNAALVLVADESTLRDFVPTYGYSYQYRPSAGTEAVNRLRGTKPLVEALDQLLVAISVRSELKPLNVKGGQQLQLVDYPPNAVRELVVNAFVHRSHEVMGTIDIEQSPEHLVISSPGPLVAGVTPRNILVHSSLPRNLLLAEVVSRLHLAERTGQGIDRAYREMLQVGKQPPTFTSDTDVRVVMRGGIGNESFVRFISDLTSELSMDVEVLLTLSELRARQTLDAQRLAEVIQRTVPEAQDLLRRLADEPVSIVEASRRTTRSRYPTYRLRSRPLAQLGRAVTYGARLTDDIDAKVIGHVREVGYITNATLQRLFDVNVFTARDLLADFRRRSILEKIGEAKGGKGVRYGPGANFPRR